MWEWVAFGVGQVLALVVGTSDLQAADATNPWIGDWKGRWESAMTPHRGPIELHITSTTDTEVMGTGEVGGVCGAKLTFRGKIEDGKLVIQEDLGRPCELTTLTLKLEGGGLRGSYRTPREGGDISMVKQ